jgi:DNA-binding response OmpR family regulator
MPGPIGERRRILIVEDEKVIADTLGQILHVNGYDVRVAYSGEAALEITSGWSPNLAVLDVMLPAMNGVQLAFKLMQRDAGCEILLFSGAPAVESIVQQARSEGHDFEILAKPVHPDVMLSAISNRLSLGRGFRPLRAQAGT